MGISKSASYLEGVRSATSNAPTTFPISVQKVGNPEPDTEYLVYSKSSSLIPNRPSFGISKNAKVRRFGWNGFKRSWCLLPGGAPESVGVMGDTIKVSVSNADTVSYPVKLSVGLYPSEVVSFSITVVPSPESFTTVFPGSAQISLSDGLVNFNSGDVSSFAGKPVFYSRQDGFEFATSDGSVGAITSSTGFAISPIPPPGSVPQLRIGLQRYLTVVNTVPSSGQVRVFGGSIELSLEDVIANSGEILYYDGIEDYSTSLLAPLVSAPSTLVYPDPIGNIGSEKKVLVSVANGDGTYSYLKNVFSDSASPSSGEAVIRTNGDVFISGKYSSPEKTAFVHKTSIEFDGLSVEFNRSAVNQTGITSSNDFFQSYVVSSQVLSRNLTQAPFFSLQNLPLDDSNLSYSIAQGLGSSTFTGTLARASDPLANGFSYSIDSKTKQLRFYSSESFAFTTEKLESVLKVPGAAILDRSFNLSIDDTPVERGKDFFFDSSSGLITFLASIGQDFDASLQDLQGTSPSYNLVSNFQVQINESFIGKKVFIKTGANVGVYNVVGVLDSSTVIIDGNLEPESFVFDFRSTSDRISSFFWKPVPYYAPNFNLTYLSDSGIRRIDLSSGEFSVSAPKGQINFGSPLPSGTEFSVEYQTKSADGTLSTHVEFSSFQISLEEATYVKNSTYASFNQSNLKLVRTDEILVYVDGVPVDPTSVTLTGNKVGVGVTLTTQKVTVTYFVSKSSGGERTFQLSNSDIYLDTFSQSGSSFSIPGEKEVLPFNLVLVDGAPFQVFSSEFSNGKTTVTVRGTLPTGLSSPSVFLAKTVPSDFVSVYNASSIPSGSSSVSVYGQLSVKPGQVFHTDGVNFFTVVSATYSSGVTTVSFSPPSSSNIPAGVLSSTGVISFPTSSLQTTFDLNSQFPVTLVDVENKKVLSGYSVSEGGKIDFPYQVDSRVEAFYVSRKTIPTGSFLQGKFARMIAPSSSNSLLGQKLLSSYTLVSPDSWYFKVSSSSALLSSIIEDVSFGSSTSGPNIKDATDPTNADFGTPSPYYNAIKCQNFDSFVGNLIGYYNSSVNTLEDIRSSMNGVVVGGSDGLFRYSGSGSSVSSYYDVQNDILDTVTSDGSSYRMVDYNRFSRLFKTAAYAPVRLNDKVTPVVNFRNTLGSLNIRDITDVDQYITHPSRSGFKKEGASLHLTLSFRNGYMVGGDIDESHLIPEFFIGQRVDVYSGGTKVGSSTIVIVNKVTNVVVLADNFDLFFGSLVADVSDSSYPGVHFYGLGHIKTDFDTGALKNNILPSPLGPSNPLVGNEVVSTSVSFSNSSTSPKRIPSLFGLSLNDDSSVPRVLLRHENELDLIEAEIASISSYGTARVTAPTVISDSSVSFSVGDIIVFESGLNTAGSRTVTSVSGSTVTVDSPFPTPDGVYYPIYRLFSFGSPRNIVSKYKNLLFGSVFSPPTENSPGSLNGSIQLCYDFVSAYCDFVLSGSCSSLGTVLTDISADYFVSGVKVGDVVITDVAGGSSGSIRKVVSFTKTTVTLNSPAPVGSFVYSVFSPSLDTSAIDFVSSHLDNCLSFYTSTSNWLSSISPSGVAARLLELEARKVLVENSLNELSPILQPLYEDRFLWIDQKVNKVTGYLSRYESAAKQASDEVSKFVSTQNKVSSIRRLQ